MTLKIRELNECKHCGDIQDYYQKRSLKHLAQGHDPEDGYACVVDGELLGTVFEPVRVLVGWEELSPRIRDVGKIPNKCPHCNRRGWAILDERGGYCGKCLLWTIPNYNHRVKKDLDCLVKELEAGKK